MAQFDQLWNYYNPQATQEKFKALLPTLDDAALRAELTTQIARTHSLQRQFAEAHQLLDELDPQITDEMPVARVRYWLERGRAFNSNGERQTACGLFEQAHDLAQRVGADFYAVDAAHMLGIAAEKEEQLAWNLRALALAQNSAETRAHSWQGSLLNNIGWTYFFNADYDNALHHFEQCLDFYMQANKRNETLIARYSIAKTWRMQGRHNEALAEQQAILAERHAHNEIGEYVEEEIGETLHAMGETEAAKSHFTTAYRELSKDGWLVANEPERLERLRQLANVT